MTALTPAQQDAARATGAVLVLAGAGSGKTRALTAGVVARIQERQIPPARLFVVTFTNKAAAEMRERIRGALGVAAPDWLGTFHGLGARQLRIEPDAAGLRPGFDILDAGDTGRILKRLLRAINRTSADEDTPDEKAQR
jgi:DNA helicase II / ATP-dependent DNA helicase PcrA